MIDFMSSAPLFTEYPEDHDGAQSTCGFLGLLVCHLDGFDGVFGGGFDRGWFCVVHVWLVLFRGHLDEGWL